VSRYYGLAGLVLAVAVSLAACGGGDKSQSGRDGAKAVAFPDSVVDEELLVRVNSHPIRGKDLRTYALLYGLGTRDSLHSRSFNETVLDGLIDRTLLWLESEAMGVAVDDSTREWFVRQFIAATGGERAMDRTLSSAHLTRSDLRQLIQQDLQVRKFIEQNVAQPPVIPDSLAEAYFRSNPQVFWTADSVRARHIIIRASQNDTQEDIENKKKTLRDIRQRVLDGSSFAEMAKTYSEGPSAPAGGDLGYFSREEMVKPFSDAAFSLKPGEVSDVVVTSFGYHIIQVVNKKPKRKLEFEEVKEGLKNQIAQNMVAQGLQNHLQMSRSVAIIERNY
jgi:peptidyl-prolyl cis-trans isomerase C